MRVCPQCRSVFQGEVTRCGIDGEALQITTIDPLIGTSIGNYQITALLGEGGMSRVYRASHHTIGSDVAIKVLIGNISMDQRAVERFRREANAMAKIHHRNVAMVHDYGTTPQGLTYMAMEFLSGRSLADAIEADGKFSPPRAARITRQIAAGLNAAHALGYVHRDLKPGNCMLIHEDGDEVVKLLDFGLVRVQRDAEPENVRLTKTGYTLGTPLYMAPEQIRGEPATPLTDLYALGVVLYEMLAGKPPFAGASNAEVCYKHTSELPPKLPECGGLEDCALQLLKKIPAQRPGSAQEVIEILDTTPMQRSTAGRRAAALSEPAITYGDVIPVLREHREWSRTERKLILGAPLLLMSILAIVAWWKRADVVDRSATEPPTAISTPAAIPPPPIAAPTHTGTATPATVRTPPVIDASPPIATPPPKARTPTETDRAALAALRRSIESDAAARGLTATDLAHLPALAPTYTSWRRAVSGNNLQSATEATQRMRTAITALVFDAATIDAKFQIVRTALAQANIADPVRMADLEGQLDELARAARSDRMTDAERPRLFQQLAGIERRIRTTHAAP
ncbi:serine/threonine protein kinase [Candidatus Uhrbacteria bacterium]|nr:serine/threonine protein kinase [Candidatus Uhrbacteria bacterium]